MTTLQHLTTPELLSYCDHQLQSPLERLLYHRLDEASSELADYLARDDDHDAVVEALQEQLLALQDECDAYRDRLAGLHAGLTALLDRLPRRGPGHRHDLEGEDALLAALADGIGRLVHDEAWPGRR